jgi:RNA polymerase sigma-70 factor (ECF subfamily)
MSSQSPEFLCPESVFVQRLQENDERTYDELFVAYRGLIAGVANRYLGDSTECGDVTQEVFKKVFCKISGFRGDSSLRTWIFRITLSEVLNRQRSWKRRYRFRAVSLDESEHLRDRRRSPQQELELKELRASVRQALTRLSHERRSILMLRDIEGLGYDDIATSLGIATGTVKSRLSRARADMRRLLACLSMSCVPDL